MHRCTLPPGAGRTVALGALAVTLGLGAPAGADELVHQVQAQLAVTGNGGAASATVVVPAFPAGLGALEGVRVEASLETRGALGCENLGPTGVLALLELDEHLFVFRAGAVPVLAGDFFVADAALLEPYDGTLDHGGASGATAAFASAWELAADHGPDAGWAAPAGGGAATVPLEVVLGALLSASPGGLSTGLDQQLSATLRVRYAYEPWFRPYGKGKPSSLGQTPVLAGLVPAGSEGGGRLELSAAVPGQQAWLLSGAERIESPFLGGTLYVGGAAGATFVGQVGPLGTLEIELPALAAPGGGPRCHQVWFRDPAHPDGTGAGLSSALEARAAAVGD